MKVLYKLISMKESLKQALKHFGDINPYYHQLFNLSYIKKF